MYAIPTTQVVVGRQGKVRLVFSDREFSWDDEENIAEVHGRWDSTDGDLDGYRSVARTWNMTDNVLRVYYYKEEAYVHRWKED